MGCTPSTSSAAYTHERVCRDLDTGSTFVPSLRSSVSAPERPSPALCVETCSGKQTFLSVPASDCHRRSPSQPCSPDEWSTFSIAGTATPLSPRRAADSDTDDSEGPAVPRR